jgi:tRNA dimethylallyltransferase
LIDVADPSEIYHAGQFLRDVKRTLGEIHSRGKRAILVGGSGFYLKALRFGLWEAPETSPDFRATLEPHSNEILWKMLFEQDEVHAKKISPNDRYRLIRGLEILALSEQKPSELEAKMRTEPDPHFPLWIVDREPNELSVRMCARIKAMLEAGFIEEAQRLREIYPHSKMLQAVGYAQVLNYLDGVSPEGRKVKPGILGLAEEILLSHRQLAKSQRTWFKNLKPNETFTLDADRHHLIEKLMKFYQ